MFRFTIRDVLCLTVVVGLGAGWWSEHQWAIVAEKERDRAYHYWDDMHRKWLQLQGYSAKPSNGGLGGSEK
jgi:hypothetical protein